MKKKNGFTLIEILAVVVVLAIVTLISVPIIINISSSVRKSALETSVKGLIESANIYFVQHENDIKDPIEFVITNGKQEGTKKLDYNGRVENAYLMLFNDNKKAVCADDGKYAASKGINDKKITVVEGNCMGYDEAYKGYVVGDANGFTSLNIKAITDESQLGTGKQNYIRVVTETPITGFYVSATPPVTPSQGMVWIVQANNSPYYLQSEEVRIGVSYVMQYENNKWNLKYAYVYNKDEWKLLYYVDMTDGNLNLENSNLGDIQVVNTFEYTGEYQEFTAVFSGYYNIELWGAQGGTKYSSGGLGAYTSGDIYLDAGEIIYIYVGQQPTSNVGGWNGGGTGYTMGGGGSTDIRLVSTSKKTEWNEFESLKSRIMVASAGSGDSWYTGNSSQHRSTGASGGTLVGITGGSGWDGNYSGTGGEQSIGGNSLNDNLNTMGGFGYGGKAGSTSCSSSSGGGAGYYGGSGGDAISSGGGGSSYISGYEGCSSVSKNSTPSGIIHTGDKYHYSNKFFLNSLMKSDINTGNGKATITLKSIEYLKSIELNEKKNNNEWNFTYSGISRYDGRYQEFIVPENGYYKIETWGAQGGTKYLAGGQGAHAYGKIYLEKDMKLYIYVGSQTMNSSGGWNGGGQGYTMGGGGATDIRLTPTTSVSEWKSYDSLKSRIMVAGAGSGSSWFTGDSSAHRYAGASGGGLIGDNGGSGWDSNYSGTGGTQTAVGYAKTNSVITLAGFGYGGKAGTTTYSSSSGGGSGYYGGAGGDIISSGGGGSSYVSGCEGCNSISPDSTEQNIIHTGDKYHYSRYYFTDINMEAGINTGNGHAKITLLEQKTVSQDAITNEKKDNNKWYYTYSGTSQYNGRYQKFIAPENGIYRIDAWGASGGSAFSTSGKGAYTYGNIYLEKNTILYIYVGGSTNSVTGGYNGGGTGFTRGGGGATDIRLVSTTSLTIWNEFSSLKSRIMVAGAGSGDSWYTGNSSQHRSAGANGGTLVGMSGGSGWNTNYSGTGGTQTAVGYSFATRSTKVTSGFGYGGNAGNTSYSSSSGGGSGYYGGAGGDGISSGGGGSSYISGYEGCNSILESSTETNIIHTGDKYHYSGYYFTDSIIQSGKNDGNGKVEITLLSRTDKTSEELSNKKISNDNVWNYTYSGDLSSGRYQQFVAPKNGIYRFELYGAQGGQNLKSGGLGGYTYGEIYLTKGTKLYVYIGEQPKNITTGGWNGGGTGFTRGGGGATDIRTVSTTSLTSWNLVKSLNSRIMVAGAGSGDSWYTGDSSAHRYAGASGGGLIGDNGGSGWDSNYSGMGGKQNESSISKNKNSNTASGFGYGGKAGSTTYSSSSGGGAGWYGGAGGDAISSGAGGSSYISGHAGCIAVTSSGNHKVTEYSTLSDSVSYTSYKFVNTSMIDGSGYVWSTEKSGISSGMPSIDGSSVVTGNIGNGYAKITYLGE